MATNFLSYSMYSDIYSNMYSYSYLTRFFWVISVFVFVSVIKKCYGYPSLLKMDVEGAEPDVLANFDMNYSCKYIKQFVLETHVKNWFNLQFAKEIRKMFSFISKWFSIYCTSVWWWSFFEQKFYIRHSKLISEINLSNFLFSICSELYFINENFNIKY